MSEQLELGLGAVIGLCIAVAAVAFILGAWLALVAVRGDPRTNMYHPANRFRTGADDDVAELARLQAKRERLEAREKKAP